MALRTESRRALLLQQIEELSSIPSVEAIVQPLVSYLQQPLENLDMQRVVDLISHDNSLAAQCLHLANSPLFGRWQTITTTRGAVVALGLQRMRDIVVSCCVLKMLPGAVNGNNPTVLWEHSLACALVCRRIAKRLGARDPEQAYLAGLLHDLGLIVNLHILRAEFYDLMREAEHAAAPLEKIENERLGFDHCEAGKILGRKWALSPEIIEAIGYHHKMSAFADYPSTIALVSVSDRLCRMKRLGYGFDESLAIDWDHDDSVQLLRETWPVAKCLNWAQFSTEVDSYLKDVHKLVSVLYRMSA